MASSSIALVVPCHSWVGYKRTRVVSTPTSPFFSWVKKKRKRSNIKLSKFKLAKEETIARLLKINVCVSEWISNPNKFQFNTFTMKQINVLIFTIILEFGLTCPWFLYFVCIFGKSKKVVHLHLYNMHILDYIIL